MGSGEFPLLNLTTDLFHIMQIPTVSLSAFAYLFSELIQYAMDRASSTGELEDR
jgi:hypothetical protein